jgi:hypothetical protein
LLGLPKFGILFLSAKPFFQVFFSFVLGSSPVTPCWPFTLLRTCRPVWGGKGKKLFSFCKQQERNIFSFLFALSGAGPGSLPWPAVKQRSPAAKLFASAFFKNLAAAPFGPLSLSFDLGVQR